MLRRALFAVVCFLMLASLASAAPGSAEPSSQALPAAGSAGPAESAGPAWDKDGFVPGQPEYRIPINGCTAYVTCGGGFGYVRCVGWSPNTCFAYPAPDLYVVCDGVAKYCPNSPWLY